MCGRYYLPEEDLPEEWLSLLDTLGEPPEGVNAKTAGEIFPGDTVPVLANSRALRERPFYMQWGYHLDDRLIFNARSETADEKPLFRDGALERRCLLPFAHYCEWEKRGDSLPDETAAGRQTGKLRYQLRPEGEAMAYLAGIYRFERRGPVFCVLTRPAEADIAFIHPRMPVMFTKDRAKEWLSRSGDYRELLASACRRTEYRPG